MKILLGACFFGVLMMVYPVWADTDPSSAHLYKKYCSVCHGKVGDGKSAASRGMVPSPANFTSPEVMATLSRERMLQSVTEGRPKTAMVAWKELLKPQEIEGIVDYIRNTLMLSSRSEDASPGRKLFAKNCSVCHGDKGDVAVWAQGGLVPPPRNFTTDNARWELTRKRMIFSVSYGRPETAMPSWSGRLSPEDIEAVVSYIRKSFMFPDGEEETPSQADSHTGKKKGAHDHSNHDASDMLLPIPNGLVGDAEWGKKFYKDQCATCHGEKGDGKGPRSSFIYPKPRNFLHPSSQNKFNRPHLFDVIAKGVRGSEMPAWDKVLNNQEIANLAEYISQAFVGVDLNGVRQNHPAAHDAASHQQHAAPPVEDAHQHAMPPPVEDAVHQHAMPPPVEDAVHQHAAPPVEDPSQHDQHAAPPTDSTHQHH